MIIIALVLNVVVLVYLLGVIPKKLKTILHNQKLIMQQVLKNKDN